MNSIFQYFDLELVLVLATLVSSIIVFIDRYWLRPTRLEKKLSTEPWYVDYSRSFFPVLLVVLILRSFVAEPFRIPSGSMMPTLLHGDFILVSKFAYGVRLPVTHQKILSVGDPERGDVVVFRYPQNPKLDYIKRVVGLPGDRVEYYNKQLTVNGQMLPQQRVGIYVGQGRDASMNGAVHNVESLATVDHSILVVPQYNPREGSWLVPEGHYFMMGDNRDNSNDSRVWGMVPEANLVGKAFMIWMNWDFAGGQFAPSRIGNSIR